MEPTTLDASAERAALQRAFAAVPQAFGVAWFEGKGGRLIRPAKLSADELRAELRAALAVNAPKGEGLAMLCAELAPGATRRRREDITSPTFVVIDHDGGPRTLGEALVRFEALGVAVVAAFPSASERAGWRDATRWRALVPLARPVAPQVYGRGVGARLLRAFEKALECTLDLSCRNPERLTFVHPRTGIAGRIPEIDLRTVEGSAIDAEAFCAAVGWRSDEGRWWQNAATARMVGGCGPEVLSILRDAGLAPRPPDARGWAGCRCPREAWHTSKSGATSTGVHVDSGAVLCSHSHSGAPTGERRGPAGAARFLGWVAQDHPELAARCAGVRDRGLAVEVREALTRPPHGEEPRRVVALAAVSDEVHDAMSSAVRGERLMLLTPTVGAGKSHCSPEALVAALPNASEPREGAEHALPSGGAIVRTRDDVKAYAARLAQVAAPVGVGVLTPAHEVVNRDGSPVCAYPELVRRVYLAGGSARASVCDGGVPTYPGSSTLGRCPNYKGCPARSNVVPWVSRDGAPGTPALGASLPLVWVAVGTHASARGMGLREGAPLVVDESDAAFAPVVRRLGAAEIALAGQWAAVTKGRGASEAPAVGRVVIEALRGCPSAVADVAPSERAAWLCAALIASQPYAAHPWWRRVRAWVELGGEASLVDVAAAAVDGWARAAGKLATSGNAPPTGGAGEAYRTAAQWAKGAPVVRCDRDGTPVVAWRSDASTLAASVCARGGGVLALDATGDVAVTRAAVAPAEVVHLPVRVVGGAEVFRLVVASSAGGRGSLCSAHYTAAEGEARKGAVHWRHLSDALASVHAARVVARRRGFGVGAGVVFAPRVVALTCEVLLTGGDVRKLAPKAGAAVWDAVNASVATAPEATRELLRSIGAERWTHYGGSLARGSNALRHLAWSITLGDDRTPASTLRARNGALGLPVDENAIRAAADSGASRSHEQAHGRLRHLQREGARLAMVHYGKVPPLDWHQIDPPAEVLLPATVRALASEPRRAEVLTLRRAVKAPAASEAPEPSPVSVEVRDAIAAGCSLADVAKITGADRDTVRRWFRGETSPTAPKHLRALRDVTDPNSPSGVRVVLRALMQGRGWAKVWAVLRAELAGEGIDLPPSVGKDLHRWVELGARLPAGALPAVVAVLPAVVRLLGLPPRAVRAVAPVEVSADGAA